MILVRNCFIAKPGQATKLANMFKDVGASVPIPNHRVLTDAVGDFNQVVFEYQLTNLAELDAMMQVYMTNPVFKEKMAGYTDLYLTGHREILRIA